MYALGWLQFSWLSAARDGVGGGVQVCRGVCVCVCVCERERERERNSNIVYVDHKNLGLDIIKT